MKWNPSQAASSQRLLGLGVVALLHVLLGWALVSGLARKVVEVVSRPIETKIIEEARLPEPPPPPPPPVPKNLPPPPPQAPPPPTAYAPPPEVPVAPPPVPAPTISTTPVAPPPAEVKISAAPPVVAAPPAPPAPPVRTEPSLNFNVCTKPEYTAAAYRAEVEGVVTVSFTMETDGSITNARVERSAGPTREHKQLDRATLEAVQACKGRPGTLDGHPERLSSQVSYRWSLER